MNKNISNNIAFFLLSIVIAVFLLIEIIFNITPPISRDALIHHLAIPKLWLLNGGFVNVPWAEFTYNPMNINLLYLVCLYFNNDILPKFIHFAFGLGTGLMIYLYLLFKLGRNWGILGLAVFLTTPIVVWLCTSAYVDLGMTFFTTCSVLLFIKWRDSEYGHFKWLVYSSLCMGIAVGSKYNALIVWVFLNLIIVQSHAHDTKRQLSSLKYGAVFFIITIIVASPWFIKNYILTGNPFYPLFDSFFKLIHEQPVQELISNSLVEKKTDGPIGFFRMREVMYGETLLETLLIPLRMFFQGDDNSYRYFQGVLNPILILFAPFILLNREYIRDKLYFAGFCIFFIFISYFTTLKQVRYILPVIPFLVILSVFGIKNLMEILNKDSLLYFKEMKSRTANLFKVLLYVVIVSLFMQNILYLKKRIDIIKPFSYLLKDENREEFLKRNLKYYYAVEYVNTKLPVDSKIFLMFLGRRSYYLDRPFRHEPSFGRSTLSNLVDKSKDIEGFKKATRSIGTTHILMRNALADKYLHDMYPKEHITRLMDKIRNNWKLVYQGEGYSVFDIQIK